MSGTVYTTTVTYESIMTGAQVFWICIAGIVGVSAVLLALVVGLFWHGLVRDALLTRLKREMVSAGYSPADVERVVRAGAGPPRPV